VLGYTIINGSEKGEEAVPLVGEREWEKGERGARGED
jgi:hypothetical protein